MGSKVDQTAQTEQTQQIQIHCALQVRSIHLSVLDTIPTSAESDDGHQLFRN